MNEIKYTAEKTKTLIKTGNYNGYYYYIMSLGTHPTAYIQIPDNYKNKTEIWFVNHILVHGGISFCENHLSTGRAGIDGKFIGWDYAHFGDFTGPEIALIEEGIIDSDDAILGKKWTVDEIMAEVKNVCNQLDSYHKKGDL